MLSGRVLWESQGGGAVLMGAAARNGEFHSGGRPEDDAFRAADGQSLDRARSKPDSISGSQKLLGIAAGWWKRS
jgi:hypothetical protein